MEALTCVGHISDSSFEAAYFSSLARRIWDDTTMWLAHRKNTVERHANGT